MTTLYHVTATKNVDAIRAEGLRTDAHGWDARYARYVWAFDDLEVARGRLIGSRGQLARRQPHHRVRRRPGCQSCPTRTRVGKTPAIDDHALALPQHVDADRILAVLS